MKIIQNDHYREYHQIIEKSREVVIDGYGETHHIIPKSCGGNDSEQNLVKMTANNHFKCHTLLPYFTTGKNRESNLYAWWWMSNMGNNTSPEKYSELRESYIEIHSKNMSLMMKGEGNHFYGKTHTEESKQKIRDNMMDTNGENNPFYGKTHSDETKEKIRVSLTGYKHTEEAKKNMSISQIGEKHWTYGLSPEEHPRTGQKCSDDTKKKMSESAKNRDQSVYKGIKQRRIQCPICEKIGGASAMKRWHFDNCKEKKEQK